MGSANGHPLGRACPPDSEAPGVTSRVLTGLEEAGVPGSIDLSPGAPGVSGHVLARHTWRLPDWDEIALMPRSEPDVAASAVARIDGQAGSGEE